MIEPPGTPVTMKYITLPTLKHALATSRMSTRLSHQPATDLGVDVVLSNWSNQKQSYHCRTCLYSDGWRGKKVEASGSVDERSLGQAEVTSSDPVEQHHMNPCTTTICTEYTLQNHAKTSRSMFGVDYSKTGSYLVMQKGYAAGI